MFKRICASLLALSLTLGNVSVAGKAAASEAETETKPALNNLVIVSEDDANDLYQTLIANYSGIQRYATLEEALENAVENQGIMVLADIYPTATPVSVSDEQKAKIQEYNIRLYVEYAKNTDALGITGYGEGGDGLQGMGFNRAVVVNAEKLNMDAYSLLYVHGARFRKKTDVTNAWLVSAKVAGYDTADFELENTEPYVLLEENAEGNVLIASTKLSQFISGRYAPYGRWQTLWQGVLSWVTRSEVAPMEWTPAMNPNYGPDEALADDAYSEAIRLNTEWYLNSGIMPNSDGTEGIYECFKSGGNFDIYGDQKISTTMRADCNGESAGNLALAGVVLNNENYKNVAYNVMEWLLQSAMATGDRSDPESAQYGLLSWNTLDSGLEAYYGDDNAKAILGMILAASALEEDKWDQRILEAILANFRTAGVNGFRTGKLFGSNLEAYGWEYYYNQETVNYASHYESLLWGCYLWAYDKTGYEPLLERSKTAISMMMAAYEETMKKDVDDGANEWTWTNGLQQERAKMILSLAWLARIEPTEEHIGWLNTMITDLMAYQDEATGALQEAIGEEGEGVAKYGPFTSNDQYGKHESPVIQSNGDPCSDALYTSSFAMMTLNESYAAMLATGNEELATTYKQYLDALSEYFVRIQQVSDNTKYNGVWTRGFDYEKWEVYGSDGDAGWGIWCTETGWSQAWISSTMSLLLLDTNIWDYTKSTTVNEYFADTAEVMLFSGSETPTPTITIDAKLKYSAGAGVLLDGVYGSTAWTDGCWNGAEGTDMEIVVDYKQIKSFDGVTLGFNRNMNSGVCPPSSVTYYVSNDGVTYTEVGSITITTDVQSEYDNRGSSGEIVRPTALFGKTVSGRYLKAVVKNPGTYQRPQGTTKTWIFMDELELYTDTSLLAKTTAEEYDGMPYRLYVPEDYDETKAYPVIMFFHGAGERGTDNTSQLKHVIQDLYDKNEALKDVIIIAPQCPTGSQWVDTPWADGAYTLSEVAESASLAKAVAILGEVSGNYNVDSGRIYAIGYSMGGFATWDILARYANVFAAGIPICGSGATDAANILKHIPIWTFHGNADTVVPYSGTQETVDAITAAGGDCITFTTYEDCNHAQIVSLVDDEETLIPWLLSQSLSDRTVFAPWENENSEAYCEACGEIVSGWIPLVDNSTNILSSGSATIGRIGDLTNGKHYHVYVSESYTFEGNFATITGSSKVCLHTNGKTLTYQGRLLARGTSEVNIMGSGTITTTGTHTLGEGTLVLEDTAKLHIYGGTITTSSNYGSPVLLSKGTGATITIEDGAVIDGNNTARCIKVTGADKIIMNGGTVQNGFYSLSKPGIEPNNSFTLITGATTRNGGNIFLKTGATFTMNGGTIKDGVAGCDSSGANPMYAGSVFVYGGKFIMNGGVIENGGATSSVTGGNIYITSGGTFTLNDGTIRDGHRLSTDNATKLTTAAGGNVYISSGTFIMNGGAVSNSNTAVQGANFFLSGGSSAAAVLNITGGTVSGGKATNGGSIYMTTSTSYNAELHISGGSVTGGNATGNGGNIYMSGAGTNVLLDLSKGTVEDGVATGNGGNIYAAASELALSGGAQVLDGIAGSGGNIYANSNSAATKFSTVTVADSVRIHNGTANTQGGGNLYLAGSGSTLTVSGGVISDGKATIGNGNASGGNIRIASGVFTMTGGTVQNGYCSASTTGGGNLYITGGNAGHEISGGKWIGGTADGCGGNIYVYNGGLTINGTAQIDGGTAVYKTYTNSAGKEVVTGGMGGAIYKYATAGNATAQFVTIGGNAVVKNGVADKYAGNIYVSGVLTVQDNAQILDGTVNDGPGGNVYLTKATAGVLKMTGGTISGGSGSSSDNVYVGNNCVMDMSGGTIYGTDGTTKNGSALRICYQLYLSGDASILRSDGQTQYSFLLQNGAQLFIDKGWTGTASVSTNWTYEAGQVIGELLYENEADPANNIAGNPILWGTCASALNSGTWSFTFTNGSDTDTPYTGSLIQESAPYWGIIATDAGKVMVAAAGYVDENGKTVWAASSDAVWEEYDFASDWYVLLTGTVELPDAVSELTVMPMDDNLVLSGSGKVYGVDPTNDDYKTYKTVTIAEGASITCGGEAVDPATGNRYIGILEENALSFHRLGMRLSAVTLRANEQCGIYYKAVYACDDVLAAHIDSYGVVFSVKDMPGADFRTESGDRNCYTAYGKDSFVSGKEVTSGAIFGIMKDTEEREALAAQKNMTLAQLNAQYGQQAIYANAYIEIDGQTLVATGAAYSLHDVMAKLDTAENWGKLNTAQQTLIKQFYTDWYEAGMKHWSFSNITKIETA